MSPDVWRTLRMEIDEPPGNELINNDKNFIINNGIRNKFGGGNTNGIRDGI